MFWTIPVMAALAGITIFTISSLEESSTTRLPPTSDQDERRFPTTTRNYQLPHLNGNLVAFCLLEVSKCGKEAADAFCRENGFREALTFQRDSLHANSVGLHFNQIKCWQGNLSPKEV